DLSRSRTQVLGFSFQLLTLQPLFLCPYCMGKPLIMFILGCPSAGKETQYTIEGRLERRKSYGGSDDGRENMEKRIQIYHQATKANY
uniref:Nucleoside-diphosphate kinase n=1 Tax=Suricata suricatta TaxID=37032 RepID=A0A673TCT2_SURSU